MSNCPGTKAKTTLRAPPVLPNNALRSVPFNASFPSPFHPLFSFCQRSALRRPRRRLIFNYGAVDSHTRNTFMTIQERFATRSHSSARLYLFGTRSRGERFQKPFKCSIATQLAILDIAIWCARQFTSPKEKISPIEHPMVEHWEKLLGD